MISQTLHPFIVRSLDLDSTILDEGKHNDPESGMCIMEAVAYITGEWTDHPKCVCPTISAFLRTWNDSLKTEERQNLKPYILKCLGTNGGQELALKRSYMAADWYARVFVPAWLRTAGVALDEATALEQLPVAVDSATLHATDIFLAKASQKASAARSATESAARSAAWSATWSAARSAAWSATWSATESAARSAAWSATESAAWSATESAAWSAARSATESAAWSATESAAWSATWSAAWSAARSAAEEKLRPTKEILQQSAFDLLDRMIALS
jgi:hypothetical protein